MFNRGILIYTIDKLELICNILENTKPSELSSKIEDIVIEIRASKVELKELYKQLDLSRYNLSHYKESLAENAHESWSGWIKWMLPRIFANDADVWLARWKRQMNTPYDQLSEEEKESDRIEADKILEILRR